MKQERMKSLCGNNYSRNLFWLYHLNSEKRWKQDYMLIAYFSLRNSHCFMGLIFFLSCSYSCSLASVQNFCLFSIVVSHFSLFAFWSISFSLFLFLIPVLFLVFTCLNLFFFLVSQLSLTVSQLSLLFLCHPLLWWKWKECQWVHSSRTAKFFLFLLGERSHCFELWIHSSVFWSVHIKYISVHCLWGW